MPELKCINDSLELLEYIRSSKNISDSKEIINTICKNGNVNKRNSMEE